MNDLISRQAAIDAVGSMLRRKFGISGDLAEITLAGLPSAQPTVDAVPVIRCRDCKYWRKTKKQCGYTYLLPQFEADEYCSRAERKGNG